MASHWKRSMCGRIALLVGLAALLSFGCGDGRLPVYAVSGQVLVKGKPAQGAYLVFHPQDGGDKNLPRPYATSDAEGKFQLTTYELEDGAPAGHYKVSIVWRPVPKSRLEAEGPDRLQGKYSNPATSNLDAEIGKEPTSLKPFDLSH